MIEVIEDNPHLVVSVDEMKQLLHLDLDEDIFNEALERHIKLATRFVERMLGKSFLLKTYRYSWKRKTQTGDYQAVKMPMTPIKEVIHLMNKIKKSRIKRYTIQHTHFICVDDEHEYVEFVYTAGMAEDPKDLDPEFKNLVYIFAQAFFEDKDIEKHNCMKVLKCYKENLCM